MAKTRLTQGLRDHILTNIINDIPRIDYDQIVSDYIQKKADDALPWTLKAYLERHPDHKPLLGLKHLGRPFNCFVRHELFQPTQEEKDFAERQRDLQQKQGDNIRLARRQVGAWLMNEKTVEGLLETGPQFAKYIPKPEEPTKQLPAIQLAEELSKIGWPKTQ